MLFTSAGMVPFKPFFQGEQRPPSRRLVSSQKSFRTTDIDEVGDSTHLTFFEMLGNFSIGDYFKKQAVVWAWEFVTSEAEGFGLHGKDFYATVHHTDDEAYELWRRDIGLGPHRIYRYGDDDNWWGPAGLEGPCGPCSELHYDFGPQWGCGQPMRDPASESEGCHPNHNCQRFVELWNLVFMQFYQDTEGKRTPLPAPSVDTGMGLERAATVLQRCRGIYDTDLFIPLVKKVSKLSGKVYGQEEVSDYALRVVVEHARALVFLISDGVLPGNEGRSYVLRRIARRALRYGRKLGLEDAFLTEVADVAIGHFGQAYPDLAANRDFILSVVGLEENLFGQNIQLNMPLLEECLIPLHLGLKEILDVEEPLDSDAKAKVLEKVDDLFGKGGLFIRLRSTLQTVLKEVVADINAADSLPIDSKHTRMLSGNEVFVLHDTFGFPKELTEEIALEHGLEIDEEQFWREVETQQQRARAAGRKKIQAHSKVLPVEAEADVSTRTLQFVGYRTLQHDSVVVAFYVRGESVGRVTKGQKVGVVLKETPFYAEAGGQIGDAGTITGPNGAFSVKDTKSPVAERVIQWGTVSHGQLSMGDEVTAQVDQSRRLATARNHTGTHLLHASLRTILGTHVRQAGSLVAPDRLRFDFSHVGPLEREELRDIQLLANEKVREDLEVLTQETTYAEAVRGGALAFFGDKYGDIVRVVTMASHDTDGAFSVELCGGTHVGATGQVGPLFILGESGIGGGMRRVEAVTGQGSVDLFQERTDLLQRVSRRLETPIVDIEDRLDGFLSEMTALRRRVAHLERSSLRAEAQGLLAQAQVVNGVNVLVAKTSAASVEALREMGDWFKAKLSSAVLVLALVQNGSPSLISMVTPDLVAKGLHAGDIVRETAKVLGGGGGGRAESGQAGGKRLDKLPEALAGVAAIVRREVKP